MGIVPIGMLALVKKKKVSPRYDLPDLKKTAFKSYWRQQIDYAG